LSVFASYAGVYDALYADKDYAAEARRVIERLRAGAPEARRLLELGCGTGLHAIELARAGYAITGVDLSETMLARAAERQHALDPELKSRLRFMQGDARNCRLNERFDAALSLFHVLSYQTTDEDMAAMFATAAAHLRAGGLFVFDFWYGPAVLAQKPEPRDKRAAAGGTEILRHAEPTMRAGENCVEVRYRVQILEQGVPARELEETHRMRYFFMPEIETALERAGLRCLSANDLDSGAPLDERTWSACVTARKH
jgi:SAM-dependent methyltransferase